jgi:hypothetical protein
MPIEEEPVRKCPDDLFSLFLRDPPFLLLKLRRPQLYNFIW